MGNPNEPRLMKPRGDGARKPDFNNATGDAGRDGFTRVARRQPPGQENTGDMPMYFGSSRDRGITPHVGERDWNRGPRFSEDC